MFSVYRDRNDCWAKVTADGRSGMSVQEHCRIVGHIARVLIERLPRAVVARLPPCAVTIAALHDVGKVSPGFQQKISREHLRAIAPEWAERTGLRDAHHTVVGAAAVQRYLGGLKTTAAAKIVNQHHGEEHGQPPASDTGEIFGGPEWAVKRRRLIDTLVAEFGPIAKDAMPFDVQSATAGLVTVADWIGSDEEFFPPGGLPPGTDIPTRAKQAVEGCGWSVPRLTPALGFKDVFDFAPHAVQREFIDRVEGPGLYVLEAPMGIGKTEAALYAAYRLMAAGHNQGLYFGLPTRLTSDKIHERVGKFLKRVCPDETGARLAHGGAWLRTFEHGGEELQPGGKWFNPRKRTLLFPFAVGTVDQALLGVLNVRHYFVRAFGLAGKVVILDEIHSYDVYTSTLIESLVKQLLDLGCSVIVLSATLTVERRRRLMGGEPAKTGPRDDDYPLIARRIAGDSDSVAGTRPADVRFSVTMDDGDDAHVADHAARIAAAGGCVLCIANTVAKAQTWYDAVKGVMSADAFQVGLLHSKFPAFRREELENEWLGKLGKDGYGRPKGCVLVGTQVLEQSVDIDADCLVTELAPTDMLLQRMGRVWRHKRGPRGHGPEVRILCGNAGAAEDVDELRVALGGKSCLVYQPYVLWRSWQVWSVLSAVRLPSDVPALLRRTYCDPPEPEPQHVVELKEILDREARKLEQYANAARADVRMPTREDDERVTTRYSDRPMQDVLLVRTVDSTGRDAGVELLEEGSPLRLSADRKDFPATVRLHRHLVSVPAYVLGSLARPGVPPWLKMHFHLHDAPPIWTLASDGAQLMMCSKPTGFTYDRWHGLRRLDSEKAAPSAFDEYQDEEFEE